MDSKDPKPEAPKDAKPEAKMVKYDLSPKQNEMVAGFQKRMAVTAKELAAAQADSEEAERLFKAKLAAALARKAAHDGLVESQNAFLGYIIGEFDLPKTKPGTNWIPREKEAGSGQYFLVAELDPEHLPAEPQVPAAVSPEKAPVPVPKHQWKRKHNKGQVSEFPAPAKQAEADTNKLVEGSA